MIKLPDIEGLQERVRVNEQIGPGPRLRAAREALGIDLEDIAKQMRLNPGVIEDLETDKFPDHLALVFVRGYLRSYAGLIGLDPEQVVEEFNAMGHSEELVLPDLKGKPQSKSRMRSQEMHKAPMSPVLKWTGTLVLSLIMAVIVVAYNYEPADKLYVGPVVTDGTPGDLPSDSVDPENNTVTSETLPPVSPSPAMTTPTAVAPSPRAPVTAPGAATAQTSGMPATAVGAVPSGEQTTQTATEPAPVPAPAAPTRRYSDDDDYDTDASNTPDLLLPKPGRTTS